MDDGDLSQSLWLADYPEAPGPRHNLHGAQGGPHRHQLKIYNSAPSLTGKALKIPEFNLFSVTGFYSLLSIFLALSDHGPGWGEPAWQNNGIGSAV